MMFPWDLAALARLRGAIDLQNVLHADYAYQMSKICAMHDGDQWPLPNHTQSLVQWMIWMEHRQFRVDELPNRRPRLSCDIQQRVARDAFPVSAPQRDQEEI